MPRSRSIVFLATVLVHLFAAGCYGRAGDTCRSNGDCRGGYSCCNANVSKAGTCEKSCTNTTSDSGMSDAAADAASDAATDAAADAASDAATDASTDASIDAGDGG